MVAGIDELVRQGLVDPSRVGVMGWSQGGYISAFLATHDAAREHRHRKALRAALEQNLSWFSKACPRRPVRLP